MDSVKDALNSVYSVVQTMTPVDFIDIGLLSYVIYFFLKLIRETRAGQLFKGIAFLLVVYVVGNFIELKEVIRMEGEDTRNYLYFNESV